MLVMECFWQVFANDSLLLYLTNVLYMNTIIYFFLLQEKEEELRTQKILAEKKISELQHRTDEQQIIN